MTIKLVKDYCIICEMVVVPEYCRDREMFDDDEPHKVCPCCGWGTFGE